MDKNKILHAMGINATSGECHYNIEHIPLQQDPIRKECSKPSIFGWPSSELEILDNTTNSEVRQALERRNQPIKVSGGVYVDADIQDDVVLDTMVKNGESAVEYGDRMQSNFDALEQKVIDE